MAKKKSSRKSPTRKIKLKTIWKDEEGQWAVEVGELKRPQGKPAGGRSLFTCIAEKIPYDALHAVQATFKSKQWAKQDGIYIAHDSMGFARYVGRGNVFKRLRARLREAPLELNYFSFYIIEHKKHEREIESLLIRLGGAHLLFNDRKKRANIQTGALKDFEAGTRFFNRKGQYLAHKPAQVK